jgi:serine/threonine protein kinase
MSAVHLEWSHSTMDNTPLLRVGDTLGRFEITAVMSGGGMGEVYRAGDTQLQRDVAIKLLRRSEPHDLDRFKREGETGASFSHPHIMSVFDVGTHQHGDRAFRPGSGRAEVHSPITLTSDLLRANGLTPRSVVIPSHFVAAAST